MILVLCIGATSAATDSTMIEDNAGDTLLGVSENTGGAEVLGASSGENNLLGAGTGTFTELNNFIQNNSGYKQTIYLSQDYYFNEPTDNEYINGINISGYVTIDGQHHIIDAKSSSNVFNLMNDNIILKNIIIKNINKPINVYGSYSAVEGLTFTNASNVISVSQTGIDFIVDNTQFNGNGNDRFIITYGFNCKIIDSVFNGGKAGGYGGAVQANSLITIINSTFTNNSAMYGGAVSLTESRSKIINSIFTDNNATLAAGAVFVQSTTHDVEILNSEFTNNIAFGDVSAVRLGTNGSTENCTFINNYGFHDYPDKVYGGTYVNKSNKYVGNDRLKFYKDLDSLSDGDTITLDRDMIINTNFNINANNVVINGNGHRFGMYADGRFTIYGRNVTFTNCDFYLVNSLRATMLLINGKDFNFSNSQVKGINKEVLDFNRDGNGTIKNSTFSYNNLASISIRSNVKNNVSVIDSIFKYSPSEFIKNSGQGYVICDNLSYIGALSSKVISGNHINVTDNPVVTDIFSDIQDNQQFLLKNNYTMNQTITISKDNVTIDGRGLTIDGNNKYSFIINGKNVIIKNITFKNCKYTYGALQIIGENATIINSLFINNTGTYGGAVRINSAANVINSTFTGNSATVNGGAISTVGGSNITNCSFINNNADNAGAINFYSHNSESIIKDSKFNNNHANTNPNIDLVSNVTLINTTIDGVENPNFNYLDIFSNIVDNSSITLNEDILSLKTITISKNNVNIDGNGFTIDANGLQLFRITGNNVTIKNIIIKNASSSLGGAIYCSGEQCSILNSAFINNTATNGGALYFTSSPLLKNNTFINNTAAMNGGAIYLFKNATLEDDVFSGNTAFSGASIYQTGVDDGMLFVENCTFNNESASVGSSINVKSLNITNSNFNNNNASYSSTAYIRGNDAIVSDCDFTGNTAGIEASTIKCDGNNTLLDNITVTKNNSPTSNIILNGNNITVTNATITNNTGNGLESNGANLNLTQNKILDNEGKGLLLNGTDSTISNNSILGNTPNVELDTGTNYNPSTHEDDGNDFDGVIINDKDSLLNVTINNIYEGSIAVININLTNLKGEGFNAIVEVKLNDTLTVLVMVINGTGIGNVSGLKIGQYNVNASYNGNVTDHNMVFNTTNFTVIPKNNVSLNVSDVIIFVGQNATINIITNLPDGENITITINCKKQIVNVTNGKATANFTNISAGTYEIQVEYAGSEAYTANNTNATLTVNKINTNLTFQM